MCKRINIFFPCLMLFYFIGSMIFSYWINTNGIYVPYHVLIIVSQLLLLLPAGIYIAIFKINIYKCIPYRKIKPLDMLLSLAVGYLLVPITLILNVITSLIFKNYVTDSMSDLTTYPFLIQILLIAVIPALSEEFLFRGLFYHSYRRNGIVGAAIFSAIAFGVAHFNINQFCYAVVMGVVFAYLVEATGSMWASMLAHFAFNTYSITMMKVFEIFGVDAENANINIISIVGMAFVGIVLTKIIIDYMAKRNGKYNMIRYQNHFGVVSYHNERFATIPYIVTVVVIILYMVVSEMLVVRYM